VATTAVLGYGLALGAVAGVLGPARERAPWRADAAVVLGAAVWRGGLPSPVLAQRARAGARLLREGRVRWVVTTGGTGARPPAEGEVGRRVVLEALRDVPGAEEHVLAEMASHTTLDNLRFAREILRAHGVRSVLVVSNGYHLARAVRMARDQGFEAWGVGADGPPWESARHQQTHWFREARLLWTYALSRPALR
jgi:uncharacterized SAM-binding protein YcdF (DUF218 family)